ncbi:MFS general substrate transporter-55 [Coleophoma cylindrospora]|uniref:MFS general substrate transporter-55 n=1 Tax=Coleophoma cylindrospora TaxID=1849047 RepID=A0A3D8R5L0_9HELO|nr:MFS general substrate transporter-55 [Coleophoma cylindrospora]
MAAQDEKATAVETGRLSISHGQVMDHPDVSEEKSGIAPDADVAAAYADQLDGEDAFTKKEASWVRWKIDFRMVPILWLNVTLPAMDKVTTSTAALYGMKTATNLTGNRYAWVGSAFYFGYLVWCFPSASILQRLPIAKTLCVALITWAFVLIGTGFANNFETLIALRVLLGALEAPLSPANFLMLSMWYTRGEQPLRAGLFFTGLSVCFTGPIGYGVGFITSTNKWRWFFWITGMITFVWGIIVGLFLPDSPVKAKFLTEREKAIHVEKLRADQTGMENKKFKKEQMIEAFLDPKTWLIVLFQFFISIPNGGLTNFAPLIINGLGYSSQRSVLLTMPTGIMQTVSSYLCNGAIFLCVNYYPKYQIRCIVIIIGCVAGLIPAVFLYTLPLNALKSRLAALYVAYFYIGPYVVSLGINTANTAGHTKKVTVNALIFITYCVSNIVGPQFFLANQAPLYVLGMGAVLASYVLSILTILMYMAYCIYENRRRDRLDAARGQRVHQDTDFKDLTDRENIHFRYVW